MNRRPPQIRHGAPHAAALSAGFLLLSLLAALAAPARAQEATAEEPTTPPWKLELGLSYVATTGNTDTSSGGFDLAYERSWSQWKLKTGLGALRAEEDGVTTAERYYAKAEGERALRPRLGLTTGLAAERDRFAGLDLRAVTTLGLRWQAVEGERFQLTTLGGLTWTREELAASSLSEDSLGAVAEAKARWVLSETAEATADVSFFPNFEEGDDYRIAGDFGLKAAISERWALKAAYQVRYDHRPVTGFDTTDTTTTLSLVLGLPGG